MSQQPPLRPAAMRGAVDLSSLGQPTPPPSAPGARGAGITDAVRVDGTDAAFQELILTTREVAAVVVLWSSTHPETQAAVDNAVAVARQVDGRLRVVAVDVQANPGIASAFQAQQVPMTVGLIAGQPVPLFTGVQPADQIRPIVDELLKVAAENGVNGRLAAADDTGPVEPPLDPLHEAAYDAIERGDFAGAARAYEKALAANPADADAKAGLAQVQLLVRTQGVDLQGARSAAAAAPTDIDAQLLAADVDVLGGHVEDAFARLVDLVRATSEQERDTVRMHLLDLFEVVGAQDERVAKARRALMSALF